MKTTATIERTNNDGSLIIRQGQQRYRIRTAKPCDRCGHATAHLEAVDS